MYHIPMSFGRDNCCFVCGKDNKDGLNLDIKTRKGHSFTEVCFPPKFQGYADVVHGGLISTILDEMAVYAGTSLGRKFVTGELSVRFKKPVKVSKKYRAEGAVVKDRGKILTAESFIKDDKGEVYASAEAKLIMVNE